MKNELLHRFLLDLRSARVVLAFVLGTLLSAAVVWAAAPRSARGAMSALVTPAAMAPAVPQTVSWLGGGAQSAILTLTGGPGLCVRITCSTDCSYRVGPAATIGNAVSTDNDLPAATPERLCLLDTQDSIRFYGANAGTAKVAQVGN